MEARIRLDRPRDDGTTLRDHLVSYWRQTGDKPGELLEPDIPPAGQHIWVWFWELLGVKGPGPLSLGDVKTWSDLMQRDIQPWEVVCLFRMDAERMKQWQVNDGE
ncbi:phage tail assembly chaperone [Microbaculum marinum]|uniref:Uncharacterized protein n=1 Tax=Microbaculum marinum TaxID=1764581 RepID=A0AAW9RH26_9HYPH